MMLKNKSTIIIGCSVLLSVLLFSFAITNLKLRVAKLEKEEETIERTIKKEHCIYMEPISEALWLYMDLCGIDSSVQRIVYAQAIIESNTGKTSNNVMGICVNGKPKKYDFWWQSVDDYCKYFYNKWDCKEDYITFLKRSKYNPYPTYWVKLEYVVSLLN